MGTERLSTGVGSLQSSVAERIPLLAAALAFWTGPASAQPQDLELAGHVGGRITQVAVNGSYVYINETADLVILDTADPSSPKPAARLMRWNSIRQLDYDGNHRNPNARRTFAFCSGLRTSKFGAREGGMKSCSRKDNKQESETDQ